MFQMILCCILKQSRVKELNSECYTAGKRPLGNLLESVLWKKDYSPVDQNHSTHLKDMKCRIRTNSNLKEDCCAAVVV